MRDSNIRGQIQKYQHERTRRMRPDREVARLKNKPTLVLKEDIRDIVADLDRTLAEHVPRGLIHIGGGSVLAAWYNHRQSTDIDLWVAQTSAHRLIQCANSEEQWRALFTTPGRQTVIQASQWEQTDLEMDVDGVKVTLFASWIPDMNRRNRQSVRGTGFGVATTEEILRGKIRERWSQGQHAVPIRDLYDLVVARSLEPRAVATVLKELSLDDRLARAKRLERLPDDWHERDPKPIIEPTFDLELKRLGKAVAEAMRTGNMLVIPKARRTGQTKRSMRPGLER